MRRRFLEPHLTKLRALQAIHQALTRHTEIVDRKPGEQSVPDIESLRHGIEAEGDQSLVGSPRSLRMLEGPSQQFIANAASLTTGRNEELRKKPQVAAGPTPGEADDVTGVFRHPQAAGVILQGEQLKLGRPRDGDCSKAVTFGEVIDAGDDKLVGLRQILRAS